HRRDRAGHRHRVRARQSPHRPDRRHARPAHPRPERDSMTARAIFRRPRALYKFGRNPLSMVGLFIVGAIVLGALLAPWITPYPAHSGGFVDIVNAGKPPSAVHLFGTDTVGRDVLTRTIYAYRMSLLLAVVVLSITVPIGVGAGLVAGYFQGWRETVIMR